ncbi:hypothetical protein [Mesorhizobium sp. WSM4313]|uniref:hypothetical protein n=1 Tax=Mesorhizobium sp. WSM4313 TaxID=2029412 RepID=UPI000BAF8DB5|nr:hypothetical protein [Mesorhizobium sp. WSM4313]PBB21650.1 hypothetical protein CK219_03495 [Mesorhizobium sp. WSM4313]
MIAEGKDSSIELLDDRVLVCKAGKVTVNIPITDVLETLHQQAGPLSEGHLQIKARQTPISGKDGVVFYGNSAEPAFSKMNREINRRIQLSLTRLRENAPKLHTMSITLGSGKLIRATGVKLYPEAKVTEIQTLRAQARNALGPRSSTSLGVLGAPGPAFVTEAAALSFISGLMANAAAKAAAKQALEAIHKAQRLYEVMMADFGAVVGVGHISQIEIPQPSLWRTWSPGGDVYLHNGDDFVSVDSPEGEFLINWRDVSAIQLLRGD